MLRHDGDLRFERSILVQAASAITHLYVNISRDDENARFLENSRAWRAAEPFWHHPDSHAVTGPASDLLHRRHRRRHYQLLRISSRAAIADRDDLGAQPSKKLPGATVVWMNGSQRLHMRVMTKPSEEAILGRHTNWSPGAGPPPGTKSRRAWQI